jgi:HEAT repeat protein
MPLKIPFQTVLDTLLDESKPFPATYLKEFSDISPENLDSLMKIWPKILPKRKLTLMEDLEDMAVTDTLTSFEDLARPLLNDPDPYVRVQAIRLLWEAEDKKLIPIYLKLLQEDENEEVQAAAAKALGFFIYLGELEKIPTDFHHETEARLLKVMGTSKSKVVRLRTLESLGYSGREDVIPLIETAYHDKDPDWVVSALLAMGRSNDDRWKKYVLSKLHAPDDDIRSEAIVAAGELELTTARAALLDLLDDEEDEEIRRDLVWSLSKIGGEGVRDKLEELIEIEGDGDDADFLEEALENLSFTEDAQFDLFGTDGHHHSQEEDFDEEEEDN